MKKVLIVMAATSRFQGLFNIVLSHFLRAVKIAEKLSSSRDKTCAVLSDPQH